MVKDGVTLHAESSTVVPCVEAPTRHGGGRKPGSAPLPNFPTRAETPKNQGVTPSDGVKKC